MYIYIHNTGSNVQYFDLAQCLEVFFPGLCSAPFGQNCVLFQSRVIILLYIWLMMVNDGSL